MSSTTEFAVPGSERRRWLLCATCAAMILLCDLVLPLDTAAGILYVFVVILSTGLRHRYSVYVVSAVCALLILTGWMVSPNAADPWTLISTRVFAVLAVLSFSVYSRALDESRGDFEEQISAINRSQMVIEFTVDGTILAANRNFLNATGYELEEIRGKHHSVFVEPRERLSRGYRAFWDRLAAGEYVSAEKKRVAKGGREVWIQASYNPILDRNGTPVKIVKYSVDVTQRVLADRAFKKAQDELKKSKEEAEQANVSKSEFLANMSHEIRTPMTAILGYTDILLESLTDADNRKAARTVKDNGKYLLSLINDILDLSRIESGKIEVENLPASPHQVVEEVMSLMSVRAKAKSLPLTVKFDGPIPQQICTDATRLRQVLINVVGNAIKFTEVGSITMHVDMSGSHIQGEKQIRFSVTDTGIGIRSDKIEKIFEPFTQADGSMTRVYGGSGLGLAISRRLVELLGGEFSVDSTLEQGSTFAFSVATGSLEGVKMVESDDHQVLAPVPSPLDITCMDESSLVDRRILLVEDGLDNQLLISHILSTAGADVELAGNGKAGAEMAEAAVADNQPFDVIVMDMQMPIMDGYTAARYLRDNGYSRPIIALTAHAMSTDRDKCLAAGCDEYTTKPVDRPQLVSLVAGLARSKPPGSATRVSRSVHAEQPAGC